MKTFPSKSPAAFTLVELLIVLAIVPISTLALAYLINGIGINRDRLEMRMDADEAARATLATWRQDVAAAKHIALDADGKAMVIARLGEDDKPTTVTYEADGSGDLVRLAKQASEPGPPPSPGILARGVTDLQFSKESTVACRIRYAVESSDGLQAWRSEYHGFATPLFPEAEQ